MQDVWIEAQYRSAQPMPTPEPNPTPGGGGIPGAEQIPAMPPVPHEVPPHDEEKFEFAILVQRSFINYRFRLTWPTLGPVSPYLPHPLSLPEALRERAEALRS